MKKKLKSIWLTIKYLPTRIRKKFYTICRGIKSFYQRGKRGYADCDVWNLDMYLVKVMSGAINRLAETTHSYPNGYEEYEDWIKDLKDIAELITKLNVDDNIHWDLEGSQLRKAYDEAMEEHDLAAEVVFDWMKEHFNNLWD